MSKCPWARYWSPNGSWCAGRHLEWQPPPSVYQCMYELVELIRISMKSLWTKVSDKWPKCECIFIYIRQYSVSRSLPVNTLSLVLSFCRRRMMTSSLFSASELMFPSVLWRPSSFSQWQKRPHVCSRNSVSWMPTSSDIRPRLITIATM